MLTEASSKQATARSRRNVFSGISDEPRGLNERSGFLNIGTHGSLNGALPSIYPGPLSENPEQLSALQQGQSTPSCSSDVAC
jgi:hypothetical protein